MGKHKNKQTNTRLDTLAMSFVMIQRGHSIDSIIILGGLRRHPRNTIHDLCKPLHNVVECHQLALLQGLQLVYQSQHTQLLDIDVF